MKQIDPAKLHDLEDHMTKEHLLEDIHKIQKNLYHQK